MKAVLLISALPLLILFGVSTFADIELYQTNLLGNTPARLSQKASWRIRLYNSRLHIERIPANPEAHAATQRTLERLRVELEAAKQRLAMLNEAAKSSAASTTQPSPSALAPVPPLRGADDDDLLWRVDLHDNPIAQRHFARQAVLYREYDLAANFAKIEEGTWHLVVHRQWCVPKNPAEGLLAGQVAVLFGSTEAVAPAALPFAVQQPLSPAESATIRPAQGRIVHLPLTLPAMLAAITLLFVLRHSQIRQRYRRRRGQCPHCGYDLRASAAQCPECGVSPASAS